MTSSEDGNAKNDREAFRPSSGRIYFSRSAERRFYFIMTLIMLVAGTLFKLGII